MSSRSRGSKRGSSSRPRKMKRGSASKESASKHVAKRTRDHLSGSYDRTSSTSPKASPKRRASSRQRYTSKPREISRREHSSHRYDSSKERPIKRDTYYRDPSRQYRDQTRRYRDKSYSRNSRSIEHEYRPRYDSYRRHRDSHRYAYPSPRRHTRTDRHTYRKDYSPPRDYAPKRDYSPKRDESPKRDASPKRDVSSKRDSSSVESTRREPSVKADLQRSSSKPRGFSKSKTSRFTKDSETKSQKISEGVSRQSSNRGDSPRSKSHSQNSHHKTTASLEKSSSSRRYSPYDGRKSKRSDESEHDVPKHATDRYSSPFESKRDKSRSDSVKHHASPSLKASGRQDSRSSKDEDTLEDARSKHPLKKHTDSEPQAKRLKRSISPRSETRHSSSEKIVQNSDPSRKSTPVDDLESVLEKLNEIKNMSSTSKKRHAIEDFMELYTELTVFTYETADAVRHSVDKFEHAIIRGYPTRVTRKIIIANKEDGVTYCIEMEWCPKKETSLVSLYVWSNDKLTRCYEFSDVARLGALQRQVNVDAIRQTKVWAIIRRYLIKKGVPPSSACKFTDTTTKYKHTEVFPL